jgi:catechol-2,3-dioxygenase
MQILELKLFSNNLKAQREFYIKALGFSPLKDSDNAFTMSAGESNLTFKQSIIKNCYHFAFLIPNNTLQKAIGFLERHGIELLHFKNEKIIQFTEGRAIYFYDRDGNIVEFIERPSLNYSANTSFNIQMVIKINEIGWPVTNTLKTSNVLIADFGIEPIDPSSFNNDFCWIGDYNGAIIITRKGRYWLPTKKAGNTVRFEIKYRDSNSEYTLKIEDEIIE